MLEVVTDYIRKVVSKIFPVKTVADALNIEVPVNQTMVARIGRWRDMYMDQPEWARNDNWPDFKTAGIPAAIASELTRLSTLEMETEITGEGPRAAFLQEQYDPVVKALRVQTEYAAALGGMMFKPYPDGDKISVDFVQADRFYPVAFNSRGDITSCVFVETIYRGDYVYTRLEYHQMLGGAYTVTNRAYRSAKGLGPSQVTKLGEIIPLNSVDEWAKLQEETPMKGLSRPLFAYFKMPFANTVDPGSSLGISVFGRAENMIRQADQLWNSINWEYEAKEVALEVNAAMLRPSYGADGETYLSIPKGKERMFRAYEASKHGDDRFYEIFSPEIRHESYFAGYNKIIQRIEFQCGLAYGTISDPQEVDKTATEIKASKQRSHATVSDIQHALENALDDLVTSMDELATLYNMTPPGDFEVSFTWDDSILVDAQTENTVQLQEVAAGILKPEIYLMRRYGLESEDQAREMMPDAEEITKDRGDDMTEMEE